MKTVFQIDFVLAKPETPAGIASKEMDLSFLPLPEMQIETNLWPDKGKIREMTLNLDEPYLRIYLGKEWIQDWNDFGVKGELYRSFGWVVTKTQNGQ